MCYLPPNHRPDGTKNYGTPQENQGLCSLPHSSKAKRVSTAKYSNQYYKKGFVRARVDNTIIDLKTIPKLARYKTHEIDGIVDRLVIKEDIRTRLYDSIETCLELGEGVMLVSQECEKSWTDHILSERYACPKCGRGYEELTPRMFSFNSPYGACPDCDGLGNTFDFDPELIVLDKRLSIKDGAIDAWQNWGSLTQTHYDNQIKIFSKIFSVSLNTPFIKLSKETADALLFGADGFEGVIPNLKRIYEKNDKRTYPEPPYQLYELQNLHRLQRSQTATRGPFGQN